MSRHPRQSPLVAVWAWWQRKAAIEERLALAEIERGLLDYYRAQCPIIQGGCRLAQDTALAAYRVAQRIEGEA